MIAPARWRIAAAVPAAALVAAALWLAASLPRSPDPAAPAFPLDGDGGSGAEPAARPAGAGSGPPELPGPGRFLVLGRFADPFGLPVEGARVRCWSPPAAAGDRGAEVREVEADATGRFRLSLPAGRPWRLYARHPDFRPFGPLRLGRRRAGTALDLGTLHLRSGYAIEGVVVGGGLDGPPVANCLVQAQPAPAPEGPFGGAPAERRSDARGRFRFLGLAPGSHELVLRPPVPWADARLETNSRPPEEKHVIRIVLPATHWIRGRLSGPGRAAADRVSFTPEGAPAGRRPAVEPLPPPPAAVGPDGAFECRRLAPGSYTLRVLAARGPVPLLVARGIRVPAGAPLVLPVPRPRRLKVLFPALREPPSGSLRLHAPGLPPDTPPLELPVERTGGGWLSAPAPAGRFRPEIRPADGFPVLAPVVDLGAGSASITLEVPDLPRGRLEGRWPARGTLILQWAGRPDPSRWQPAPVAVRLVPGPGGMVPPTELPAGRWRVDQLARHGRDHPLGILEVPAGARVFLPEALGPAGHR